MEEKRNYIIFFDLDSTVASENTLLHISSIINNNKFNMDYIYDMKTSWIDTSSYIFKTITDSGKSIEDMKEKYKTLPLTKGFPELFDFLRKFRNKESNINIEVVLLTGANQIICDWTVEIFKLDDIIDEVVTYKTKIIDNTVQVLPFHEHKCPDCEIGLCKEQAIHELIEKRKDIKYEGMFFAGDGDNDYCAGLGISKYNLKAKNTLFARKDYMLHDMLILKDGKTKTDLCQKLNCNLEIWEDGFEIMKYLEKEFTI